MEQCEHLGTIKELRKLNMSLRDIREFMTDRNLEKSGGILRKHTEILRREIEEKLLLSRILDEKIAFIEQIKSKNFIFDSPVIREIPDRCAIKGEFSKLSTAKPAVEFMKLEESLNTYSPILATNRVAMYISDSLDREEFRSYVCPLLFCTENERKNKKFTTVEGGKYICAYHADSSSYLGEIIAKMRFVAEENGFVMESRGIMIYQVDITLTDHSEETVIELQYPLRRPREDNSINPEGEQP